MTFKGLNLEDIKRTVDPTRWMQRIFAEGMMIKENFDVHFHILYLGVIKKQREVVGEDSTHGKDHQVFSTLHLAGQKYTHLFWGHKLSFTSFLMLLSVP